MLKNYIMVALRNLQRERLYAAINVIGLAVALTICLLAYAYVKHELSFDHFHANAGSLYRVNNLIPDAQAGIKRTASTSFLLAPILRERLPEITAAVAVTDGNDAIVNTGTESSVQEFIYADSQFFSVFSFPLLAGDPATALNSPYSAVVSERVATRFFGGENPVGRTVPMEIGPVKQDFVITGVCQNPPGNSTLQFDMIIPLRVAYEVDPNLKSYGWNLTWPTTYLQLRPDAKPEQVDAKLKALAPTLPMNGGEGPAWSLQLQSIAGMHFDPEAGAALVSNPVYCYVLSGVALLVLMLACINFMTLAIGRAQTRTKEVGIRKVLGARAEQLLGRFLGEAAVLCTLAILGAFAAAELLLPAFNRLADKQISRQVWLDWPTLALAFLLIILTSVLAGGYPAAILARTKLRDAVKGRASLLTGTGVTRGLVALQFGLSIALIIGAIIMSSQIRYLQSLPLGFDKEQLLMVNLYGQGEGKARIVDLLRNSLANNQRIVSLSASGRNFDGTGMTALQYMPDGTRVSLSIGAADEEYVKTLGLTVTQGTDFTGNKISDSAVPVLVNETLVKRLGWQSPLGQVAPGVDGSRVIGVVNDFHVRSLAKPVDPLVIPYAVGRWADQLRYIYFRLSPGDPTQAIEQIHSAWSRVAPALPFEFQFVDDHIDAQYRAERRWRQIVGYSAALAIAVACFGAFGLTALAVARRRKEIGVRKVLGASSGQIVNLLNREFMRLVLIGNLLAWPVAYFATTRWLNGFAYHLNPSVWPFVLATLVTMIVVIGTVSFQALRAAVANPADALRYE